MTGEHFADPPVTLKGADLHPVLPEQREGPRDYRPPDPSAPRLHPDDGYAYDGCEGSACRALRTALAATPSAPEAPSGPFIAYFTTHGEGWIVTDRERPGFTRIATVDTSPDDYGRANTLLIADALNRSTPSANGDGGLDVERLVEAIRTTRPNWFGGDRDDWWIAEPEGIAADIAVAYGAPTGSEHITSTDQLEAEQRGLPVPFASPKPTEGTRP